MKIKSIKIQNYKSIKSLDIIPSPKLNVFLGENGTGKSNLFAAINWLLGPYYPTFNAITKQDHYMGDDENKISIGLEFDTDESLELNECKEIGGQTKSGLFYNNQTYNCRGEIRDKFCSAYIGVERQIVDYLPSNRWSLLGRILLDINKKFEKEIINGGQLKTEKLKEELNRIRDELLFSVTDDDGNNIMHKFMRILQEESANQMHKSTEDFQLNFNLYDPWNFYRTLQILVYEPDIGLTFQASQLGMGAQAAITIAILRAYSEIKLGGGNPIFIDEPELFLHPQAQRNFYRILRKLADEKDIQIFYITHSPFFIDLAQFDEMYIVRKSNEKGTFVKNAKVDKFIEDLRIREEITADRPDIKLHYKKAYEQTADSLSSLEAFFAKKIVLVEGDAEALALPYLFEKSGFAYIKEKITIVKCGGKTELDRFYRLYTEFGIPCFVIFDGDKDKNNGDIHKKRNNELFNILKDNDSIDFPDNEIHTNYLGFENDFNYALKLAGFRDVYNDDNPKKSPKGLKLFLKIREQIESDNALLPEWIEKVTQNILRLPMAVESVLKIQEHEVVDETEQEIETPF